MSMAVCMWVCVCVWVCVCGCVGVCVRGVPHPPVLTAAVVYTGSSRQCRSFSTTVAGCLVSHNPR